MNLQKDPADGWNSAFDPQFHLVSQLSPIQSNDPEVQRCSLEETERLKSLRVIDWVHGDSKGEGEANGGPPVTPELTSAKKTSPAHTAPEHRYCLPASDIAFFHAWSLSNLIAWLHASFL